ncbi:MAG: glycoside hydrolase family 95 protein, partial [Clostridia bacterium]|nr:glycoside hydrolase family 95 protein [Clostridia bacterium]
LFQIDGNFGAIAAVIEALCGYFDEEVHLLRALPENWQTGELCGIRVPGGHDIDLKWKDGKLTEVSVRIGYQGSVALRFPDGRLVTLSGNVGEVKSAL